MHQAAGPQRREQNSPAFERIGHMVKSARGIDHVETSFERCQLEYVGLGVFNLRRYIIGRAALRVA